MIDDFIFTFASLILEIVIAGFTETKFHHQTLKSKPSH